MSHSVHITEVVTYCCQKEVI